MSSGSPDSATQRNGPLPSQNSGRMYAGMKPGNANASLTPATAQAYGRVAVVERLGAAGFESRYRADMRGTDSPRAASYSADLAAQLAPPARGSGPPGCIRSAGRAQTVWSVTTSIVHACRTSSGNTSAALPSNPIESGRLRGAALSRAQASSEVCRRSSSNRSRSAVRSRGSISITRRAAVHRDRQRLRAAHPAEARRSHERPLSDPPKCFRPRPPNVSYVPCRMPCVPM